MFKKVLFALLPICFIFNISVAQEKNMQKITPQSKTSNTSVNKAEQKYSASQQEKQNGYTVSIQDIHPDSSNKPHSNAGNIYAENKNVMTEQDYNNLISALETKLNHIKKNKSEYKKAKKAVG
jgi:hypothetical protein